MEADRQLTIRGAPAALESWARTISDLAVAGWSRGTEIERKVKLKRDARWPICLIWAGDGRHPKTALFLRPVSDTAVAVTSVVPLDRKELAPGDRRAALEAFEAVLIVPSGEALVVEGESSSEGLSEAIGPQALARFVAFAQTA